MSAFDPNAEPGSQEQADAYVTWCAEQLARLSCGPARTYRTAIRCAAWLLVVAAAQLHLDDAVARDREALLEQLACYSQIAREIERQRQRQRPERLVIIRASLDCWEGTGEWGDNLLGAARCAVSALLLIELHPLVELWDTGCSDVWALLDTGVENLATIDSADALAFSDFSVRPDELVTAKFTWQRANRLVRHLGVRLSEN